MKRCRVFFWTALILSQTNQFLKFVLVNFRFYFARQPSFAENVCIQWPRGRRRQVNFGLSKICRKSLTCCRKILSKNATSLAYRSHLGGNFGAKAKLWAPCQKSGVSAEKFNFLLRLLFVTHDAATCTARWRKV